MASHTPSYSRGAYAGTEEFRKAVLDAALQIVAEEGFDATTLQEIADRVGKSKAGLLHHFGSRENLMLEILHHRDVVNRQRFLVQEGREFDAVLDLLRHNAKVPGLIALYIVVASLAATDTGDSQRREYFTELYARNREIWVTRIERAQEAGTIRTDISATAVAALIIAVMDGMQIQWLLDHSIDMAEHLRALIPLLSATDD